MLVRADISTKCHSKSLNIINLLNLSMDILVMNEWMQESIGGKDINCVHYVHIENH